MAAFRRLYVERADRATTCRLNETQWRCGGRDLAARRAIGK